MTRAIALALALTACLASAVATAQEPGLEQAAALERTFVRAIERAEASVVSITLVKSTPENFAILRDRDRDRGPFDGQDLRFANELERPESPTFVPREFGSGIVIAGGEQNRERFILTAYHVVKGGPTANAQPGESTAQIHVRFANRRGCTARIFAADPRSDLAVLILDPDGLGMPVTDLPALEFGDGGALKKGQFVLSLGNPYAVARDGSASASWGIISNIARRPAPIGPETDDETARRQTLHHFGTLIVVDARQDVGTSGGALVNLEGRLIGITTSLAALEGYEKSVGYAIPIDESTRRIIDSLTRGEEVEYGFLGMEPADLPADRMRVLANDLGQASAAITQDVMKNSPASAGGLIRGDVILEINGRTVFDRYDLMKEVGRLSPGTISPLRVYRPQARRELTLNITLGKWPVINEEELVVSRPKYPPWRGLSVDFPTARRRFNMQILHHNAVVVISVESGAPAADAQIQPGDFITHVNQTPVATPAQFAQAVAGLNGEVTLQMIDGRKVSVGD